MKTENENKRDPIKEGETERIRKAGEDLRELLGISLFEVTNSRRHEDYRRRVLQKRKI